ncbi:YhgE/Pip domain-containing protein [Microbacterium sp. YY-01]|uniref:YhgE/Pip domain-containing protein n=1 Tax=Microbacterium sp. YY-01 TaxID=3421634 RepID=UPI003D173EB1
MTMERARSHRPVTWLTLLGVLLLPALIGGILVFALQSPDQRLDSMSAAIVNLDEPVTLDDQLVPLGRQLAAGLVEGSDDIDSNLDWVISNADDAAEGLSDGTYQAIVTIPENFSAAATSGSQAISEPEKSPTTATITVDSAPDGRIADSLLTSQIAQAATSALNSELAEATIDNVLVNFTTLGDSIDEAADGADQLASGSRDAADGAGQLPEGATQLSDGAAEVASGAGALAEGLDQISTGASDAADGASQLGTGLAEGATALRENGLVPAELSGAASAAATTSASVAESLAGAATSLGELAEQCFALGPDAMEFCMQLAGVAETTGGIVEPAYIAAGTADGVASGLGTFDTEASATLAGQMETAAEAASSLSSGISQLGDGVDQSATGARALGSGASQLSSGAGELAEGATELSAGLDELSTGTSELAAGLGEAASKLPRFTDDQSQSIASAVASPVEATSGDESMFSATTIPLLAAVALWLGGLASFIALRAVSAHTLTSRRSSTALALRSFAPAAVLGAAQGVLVALVVQFVADYSAAHWWTFAGIAAVTGIAFAAVHQALVAVFGGAGRWIAALAATVATGTGILSTVPAWLVGVAQALPTAPALTALLGETGASRALVGLMVWAVLSLIVTIIATALQRTTSARGLARAASVEA